jgi:glycerol uptake facilitator-like aquaporin
VFGSVSGAHVNPAVTIGLLFAKKIPLVTALLYVAVQLLGGATAMLFYNYARGETLSTDPTAPFAWSVFVAEMVGALLFGMGIAAAVVQKMEGLQLALTIGLSLTIGALVASAGSAGFLNPAVALANNSWDRTYVLAPIVGMVVGMNAYFWLFSPAEKPTSKKRK